VNTRSLKVAIVSVLGALACFIACGESKKSAAPVEAAAGHGGETGGETGGQAGAAAEGFDPVRCGSETCNAIGSVPPCCADPLEGICGVELGLTLEGLPATMICQPLTQSGKPDPGCPASMARVVGGLPLPAFPGCCREATGQCGYLVSDVGGLLPFTPGCIDATLLGGEEAKTCGPGANEGGATGAGGTPSADGGAMTGGTASGEGGSGGHGGVPGGAAGEAGAPIAPGFAGEGGLGGN
jgi:hypothetical protein